MKEIKITGNKKLKTINKEIQEKFPYFYVIFLDDEEYEKTKRGETVRHLPYDKTLAEVRKTKPKDSKDISIHGRTKVGNLEKNFKKEYGINLQICYRDKNGNGYYTSGKSDDMTLAQLNKLLEEEGYKRNPEIY